MFETGPAVDSINIEEFPSRADVGAALAGHLRAIEQVLHATDRTALLKMLQEPVRPAGNTKAKFVWPADQARTENITGEYHSPFSWFLLGPTKDKLARRVKKLSVSERADKYDGGSGILLPSMLASLQIPEESKRVLLSAANKSIACNTHSAYSGGIRSYLKSCEDHGLVPEFPPSVELQLVWQADLSKQEKAATTMRVYWSALKKVSELVSGKTFERHQLVGMAQRGAAHGGKVKEKCAVTWRVMKELRSSLDRQPAEAMSQFTKNLLWSVATTAMTGSFRLSELLPTKGKDGVWRNGLMAADFRKCVARIKGKSHTFLLARVRQPKEKKNGGSVVDVELFATESQFCPVKAAEVYLGQPKHVETGFAFKFENGEPLTKPVFNRLLKKMLRSVPGYRSGVTGHSFRRGVPSAMAAAGYSEDSIKRQGRWHSDSHELYEVSGTRANRLTDQLKLHRALARLAEDEVRGGGNMFDC